MKFCKLIAVVSMLVFSSSFLSAQNTDNSKVESSLPFVYNIDTVLTDPLATASAQKLYKYMLSQFGKRIISGQTDGNYNDIVSLTGKHPVIFDTDFQSYTQGYSYLYSQAANNGQGGASFGWYDSHNTENAIKWYNNTNKKGILSFQWHWHSPTDGQVGTNTFYTQYTNFDARFALITTTSQFRRTIEDIDSIASQIRKLSKADIPVLFRPLHEASGSGADNGSGAWFWWGAKGNVVCKKLYDMIHDRIVNYHGLHNVIWVSGSPEASWYAGTDKIDIMGGVDSYAGNGNYTTQKSWFNVIYNTSGGKKMLAMTENGPIPNPEWCIDSAATWSYFMTWYDFYKTNNSSQHVIDVYNSSKVVTLENRDDDVSTLPGITTPIVAAKDQSSILVYPNPTNDKLYIADKAAANNIYKIEVYSLQGSKLIEKETYKDYISLDGLQQGIYVLNLYLPNRVVRQKVSKW